MINPYEHMILGLMEKARIDDLTGLGNRRAFMEHCTSLQSLGVLFSVILFDMTNLKRANLLLGHFGADDLLRAVACKIRSGKDGRTRDAAYRYGGDEFAVVLEGGRGAFELRDRLEEAVGVRLLPDGTKVAAIGVLTPVWPDTDLFTSLNLADKALEQRKAAWKARP